jgi:hypothetical protein
MLQARYGEEKGSVRDRVHQALSHHAMVRLIPREAGQGCQCPRCVAASEGLFQLKADVRLLCADPLVLRDESLSLGSTP